MKAIFYPSWRKLEIREVPKPSEVDRYWSVQRPEVVLDAVGSTATKQLALDLVEPGGCVVWVGLHEDKMDFSSYSITLGQKCVAGSYSGSLNDLHLAASTLSHHFLDTS